MIHVQGHKFMRDGDLIGWLDGAQVYDENGLHVGYFENEKIYEKNGSKLGHIQGDYLHFENGEKMELNKLREHIEGGEISDLARGAARILLGD